MFSLLSAPRLIVLLLAVSALTPTIHVLSSNPYPVYCHVQILGVNYPANPQPNQTLTVTTHLEITCTSTQDNVLARVDVLAAGTNRTIASKGYGIGNVEVTSAPYVKVLDIAISNTIAIPSTVGNWSLRVVAWVFAGVAPQDRAEQLINVQVGELMQTTSTTTAATISQSSQTHSTTSTPTIFAKSRLSGFVVIVVIAVIVGLITWGMFVMRRRRAHPAIATPDSQVTELEHIVAERNSLSTGYHELDYLLDGGLPVGYAIILLSPPFDERDLIFRKVIESGLSAGFSVFFMSSHLGRSQDLASRYAKDFYVLSSQADRISPREVNVFKIAGVQNLNDVNISFGKTVHALPKIEEHKLLIIDLLSDVLLENKALTTRKWLDDFLARRKTEGYTVIATLNPLVSSSQENQTVIDLFDGVIEIYEKQFAETSRRFLIIKKMYGRKYMETELMLDKNKLF